MESRTIRTWNNNRFEAVGHLHGSVEGGACISCYPSDDIGFRRALKVGFGLDILLWLVRTRKLENLIDWFGKEGWGGLTKSPVSRQAIPMPSAVEPRDRRINGEPIWGHLLGPFLAGLG